jgi:hypothetical protein
MFDLWIWSLCGVVFLRLGVIYIQKNHTGSVFYDVNLASEVKLRKSLMITRVFDGKYFLTWYSYLHSQ